MPTPFNIRKNLAKLLARLLPKKADELFDTTESEMSSGHESRDRASEVIMKKPSFDMSIPAKIGNSAEDRIKGLGIMFMLFCHENIIEYLCHLSPEGATGSEIEQFLKSRAREADPDKETFTMANMFIKDFWTYYSQVIVRLGEEGFIYAGDEKKYFANPTLPTRMTFESELPAEALLPASMAQRSVHKKEYEEAIGHYDKAIEISTDDSRLFINRGLAKEGLGDDKGAITDYENAVKVDPDNSHALFLLGSLVIDAGDLAKGIEYLDKSIENDPSSENSEAYRYRGIAKNESGMYREALNDFLQLISFNSLDGEAHLLAGYNHIKLGSFQLSLNYFKRAIEVFEENVGDEYELCECYLYLGDSYLELNDVQSACVNWKKAMDLGNEDAGERLKKHCA